AGAAAVRGEAAAPFVPVPNRGMITISIMCANIMQGVDNSILNVALSYIQGSLSASLHQVAWALTSYIVCASIMMPLMVSLAGWLTYEYSWRWVFFINLPVGVLCILGNLIFIRQTRYVHREPFDFVGFLTLSLAIGALQLMLDRGELKDWFHSSEIWIEATV